MTRQTMLSRVADSLYWMSRYLERADHVARQLDVHLNVVLDQSTEAATQRRRRLIANLVGEEYPVHHVGNDYDLAQLLTFDEENGNSIVRCIATARENARQIREQINSQMWEQINQLYLAIHTTALSEIWQGQPHLFYHGINQDVYRFHGITDARMTHDQGWHFVQLGCYMERAIRTANTVDIDFRELYHNSPTRSAADQNAYLDWVGMLKSCAAFEAYSKVYTADLHPRSIVEFLVLNSSFPHSVHFAINTLQTSLEAINAMTETSKNSRVYRLAGRLRASLDYGQVDEIMESGLGNYLLDIQNRCAQIHEAIYQTYISYTVEDKLVD